MASVLAAAVQAMLSAEVIKVPLSPTAKSSDPLQAMLCKAEVVPVVRGVQVLASEDVSTVP